MGKFPIVITEVKVVWAVRRVALPPKDDRKRLEEYTDVNIWFCYFPLVTPLTDRFVLSLTSLEDIKGVAPAHKQFPEATHEISLYACSPDVRPDQFDRGEWLPMVPVN